MKDRAYPYLQKVALETGLLPAGDRYTRFIILGRSRVGTNFLRGLLNSHNQVRVFGEVFQNKEQIAWALPGYRQSGSDLQLFRQQPVRFLEKKVFHKFPAQITAVGFKIFYYHARDPEWAPLWQYLQEQEALKVIHVKRRNILETHLSRQRAIRTDNWVNTTGERTHNGALALSFEECLKDFEQTRCWEEEHDAFFAAHDAIDVIYEELAADRATVMQQVQSFLGLAHQELAPETYKQSHAPLSAAIANFDELRERFAGTPWAPFFAD
ncbi:MAG TPA: sulfotransferase [Candidatus Binatia bacterium]|nr:sulfotransferase [Candidatus Binatia bacterium]